MSKANVVLKNIEMASMAIDTLEELELSDEMQILDSILKNKVFVEKMQMELISSLFTSTSDTSMMYLKNSSHYLKDAKKSLGVVASIGSESGTSLTEIKNDIVKGTASYIFFIAAFSMEFLTNPKLELTQEEKTEINNGVLELKESIEEMDLFSRFKNLDYYKEKNIEFEEDTSGDDDESDTAEVNMWDHPLDTDDFKED